MLRQLNLLLLRAACRLAMRRVAPDQIPRSLPRAAGIDYFSLTINGRDNEWSLLVDTVTPEGASGRWLDGNTYSVPAGVSWESALDASIDCSHYIGVYEFQYKSPLVLLFRELLLLPRIEIFKDRLQQKQFNRQRLVRRERIAILKLVAEEALRSRNYRANSVTLAAQLYSNRVFFHPEREQMLNYCSLLLDSLASSGDLTLDNHAYRLAPRALQTMATHEEEDRRHRDMLAQQRAAKWLTFALIFVGLLQVYASWKSS
jgi:hypothetical protein